MADAEAQVMSEKTEENVRLVPVSESIRYRKRAQQAEQKVEELTQQLSSAKDKAENLAQHIKEVELAQKLTKKLIAAGACDIETALLVAKSRAGEKEDLDNVIEQMKTEKGFLFNQHDNKGRIDIAWPTAGAKDGNNTGVSALRQAAERASSTGSPRDLQEYLKLRRNYI